MSHARVGFGDTTDRRAQRLRALGEVEQARAAADAVRARTAVEVSQFQAAQAERRAAARDRARRARRIERSDARARWVGSVWTVAVRVGRGLPVVAGVVACVAPTLIATRGQYQFAVEQMRLGGLSVLVPLMLEGAAWLLVWRRHLALGSDARDGGGSTSRLTGGVWALALTAAGMNIWHGAGTDGGTVQVGVMYGVASLVGFGLVELLAGQHRAVHWTAGGAGARRGGRWAVVLRAARYPRLCFAAWSRRLALGPLRGHTTDPGLDPDGAGEVWRQVWIDRFGVGPDADARTRSAARVELRAQRRRARRTPPRAAPPATEHATQLEVRGAEVLDEHGLSRMWEHAPPTQADRPDRAAELIAAGAGRRRLSRELEISEYEARQLIERTRTTTSTDGAETTFDETEDTR